MRFALALMIGLGLAGVARAGGRPMTVDDLLAVKSVGDPQLSPDGRLVAYVVSEVDRAAGKTNSSLWLVTADGGNPKRLTTTPGVNNHPRWCPDGKTLAFASNRGGSTQVWLMDVDGGEPRQLTHLAVDVAGPVWSPKGDKIAFVAEVEPGKTPEQTDAAEKARGAAGQSKVRVYDKLMVRHWDAWVEGKRSHLFVADAVTGAATDLTPGLDVNTPPAPFGGSTDYAFAPDGQELAFTTEPKSDFAWSTNTDVWTVPVTGGEPKNVTAANPGADAQPAYSPDGKTLAYLSQARAGFESDIWVLTVQDRQGGKPTRLGLKLDRPVQSFAWSPTVVNQVLAAVETDGVSSVLRFDTTDADGVGTKLVRGGTITGLNVAAGEAGKSGLNTPTFVYARSSATAPNEVFLYPQSSTSKSTNVFLTGATSSEPKRLTHHNDALLAALDLAPAEAFRFPGADGDTVAGWLIKPPGFDPTRKYPAVFLIHGGPQGAWHDDWSARWNYQMFAAPGFAVVAVNPRGSTGYGQKFTDQISRDWTGRVFDDLMKGLDHALKTYPFLDGAKVAAAGGSYGGFMVNWIAGHTGVFDLASMYGTTEELWFAEWEFGGTPWENPKFYADQSPSLAIDKFRTPTLVIHGALDYRVPEAQGLGMFTALQRRGVASRLVFFPDEGHWILKPANRVAWWSETLGWLNRYLR